MAKAKTKKAVTKKSIVKKKNNLVVFWEKYTTQILVGLAILAVVGYWFGSVKLPAIQEKRDLDASYVELQEIADKISAVEEPDSREQEKYCSYSSAKFEKGDLSCTVETKIRYVVNSVEQSNKLKENIVQLMNKVKPSGYDSTTNVNKLFYEDKSYRNKEEIITVYKKDDICKVSFFYAYKMDSDDRQLSVLLDCSVSFSKAEHYTVKD